MKNIGLYGALVNDPSRNPERSGATFERVREVIENVLGEEKGSSLVEELSRHFGDDDRRRALTENEAEMIVDELDRSGVTPVQLRDMAEQIMLCEFSTDEILDVHLEYKIPVSALETDILPIKGDGSWIMDSKGKWYLDLDSNYSASNLGMANPEIALGIYNQAKSLICQKEDRIQVARTRFLKEIGDMMPDGLNYFYWQNSGGEAVDKSLKIAKAYTQTKDVIAFKQGFHGRTHGAVAVTYNEKYRKPFLLHEEDWVHFADFNDLDSVKKVHRETGARIIMMEMVQGEEAGNRPADPDFIDGLWKYARENDILIIDDEVQAGFGRTAKKSGDWFACDSYDVVPDIMVIGKSFGGGYPVTAVVTSEKIKKAMKPGYDGSTFGGNPMAMCAALIATRQMRRQDITGNVIARSKQVEDGFGKLLDRYDVVKGYRIHGLMLAVDLGSDENVKKVQAGLRTRGVKSSLSTGNFIRFLPPTIISAGEADHFIDMLDASVKEL